MTKIARAVKLPPIIPSRQGSSSATEEPTFGGESNLSFPPSNRLIITTKKGVYNWDVYGITEIFDSGSEGIVAAKIISADSELLAVADRQVVVLHDISGGMQRSYRLKGADGQVRLLKYGKESRNLFFTTTLQNSVQSFSLEHSKLLDPTYTHPSPPSVFALSCTSQFLLSTSPAPPTIHLTHLALSMPPVLVHPQCSSSAVVAAEFHPERENYFCIGFEDGTAALYDAYHFYDRHGKGRRSESAISPGNCGEKAFIRGLHVGTTTKNALTGDVPFAAYQDQGGIGPKESGISAVAFAPRRKATVVTIGADGKCCVVDFTQPTKHKAVLLKSWHIRRPATSLSIICSTGDVIGEHFERTDDAELKQRRELHNDSYYIAVGSSDGRVLLFDLDGKALGEQAFDQKGAQVIDLEWTELRNAATLPSPKVDSGIRRSPVVKRKRKSLGSSTFVETRPLQLGLVKRSPDLAEHSEDPLFDFTTPRKTLGAFHWEPLSSESSTRARGREINGIGETNDNPQRPTYVTPKSSRATAQREAIENSSQGGTDEASSFQSSTEYGSTPPIPPRPTSPKPGGRLSMRRAQTARQSDTQSTSYLSIVSKARKVSAGNPRLSRGLSIATPPTKTKVLFGPRKQPSPEMINSRDNKEASQAQSKRKQLEDAWLDVPPETPRRTNEVSPVSSATSNKSYKTAMSQPYRSDSPERSDETVVDWTAGLPRKPVPTLQITHPSGERSSKTQSKKKGHISLSVSSESAGTSTPTLSVPENVVHPTDHPPTGSLPKNLPSLPAAPSTDPSFKQKVEAKQKGHVSLSNSSASNSDTITPISSGSEGPIIQWPSLKKSPRIPDLNQGLADPKKYPLSSTSSFEGPSESATSDILQGYAASPSPSPPSRAENTSWLVSTVYPEGEAPPLPPRSAVPDPPVLVSTVDLERRYRPGPPCTCGMAVQSSLETSFRALRAEIAQRFEDQMTWFEELVRDEEQGMRVLREENRVLREELEEFERGNEGGRSRG